jgi:hypothetical protein
MVSEHLLVNSCVSLATSLLLACLSPTRKHVVASAHVSVRGPLKDLPDISIQPILINSILKPPAVTCPLTTNLIALICLDDSRETSSLNVALSFSTVSMSLQVRGQVYSKNGGRNWPGSRPARGPGSLCHGSVRNIVRSGSKAEMDFGGVILRDSLYGLHNEGVDHIWSNKSRLPNTHYLSHNVMDCRKPHYDTSIQLHSSQLLLDRHGLPLNAKARQESRRHLCTWDRLNLGTGR